MKERKFIKVVAVEIKEHPITNKMETMSARGISTLKSNETVLDFVSKFMSDRGITTFELYQRSNDTWASQPIMRLNENPKSVITFTFTVFTKELLGHFSKDLTDAEKLRDLKKVEKAL